MAAGTAAAAARRAAQAALAAPYSGDGPRAAEVVARVREATGAGPSWRELAAELGWPPEHAEAVIRHLTAAGWLSFKHKPRSLRPGHREG